MGACAVKVLKQKVEVVEPERRRLSVNQVEKIDSQDRGDQEQDKEQVVVAAGAGHNLQDPWPVSNVRLSLTGMSASSSSQQQGFADKLINKSGPESLSEAKVGYACKKGLKPESPNQDDFCILKTDGAAIYGVFDGHGPYGHNVAGFVRGTLPSCLTKDQNFDSEPAKAMACAFNAVHDLCLEAQTQEKFDCSLSGATATLVLHRQGEVYVAHTGDCRAVLAKKVGNELQSEDLTRDHKPSDEGERLRIQAAGGAVRRLDGDIPHRVFLKGKMYPGLAMTRSIGDSVGIAAGITCEPEVSSIQVQADWRFMLICSDGIWEFISSQEAVEMINKFPPSEVQQAVDALTSEAWDRWIGEEKSVVDDITVICVWFNAD